MAAGQCGHHGVSFRSSRVTEAGNRPLQRLPTQVAVMGPSIQGGSCLPGRRAFWGAGQLTGGCEWTAPWTETQLGLTEVGRQMQGNSDRVLRGAWRGRFRCVWDVLSP